GTTMIYLAVGLAALARIAVALLPATTMWLLPLSGLLWCVGFLSFAILYAPVLLLPALRH
ncbi:MAG TPA: NnrS family protein, partial [Rhabdaerophilum sp.]|nr:NnrS family protein [Rhabdaerophilum sp.]